MKTFSLKEAEKILTEIRPIIRDIKKKSKEYSKCLIDATQLVINFRENPRDTEGVLDRTIKTRKELRELFDKLEEYGVILRDIDLGLVDFPTEIDGVEAFYCWRSFDESEIKWWHRKDEICKMRKPIKKEE